LNIEYARTGKRGSDECHPLEVTFDNRSGDLASLRAAVAVVISPKGMGESYPALRDHASDKPDRPVERVRRRKWAEVNNSVKIDERGFLFPR
jgi:hypothetical protein